MSSTINESRVSKSSHQFNYWYGRFLLIVAGFVVALIFVELMLRLLGIGYGTVHMSSSELLHHEHPKNYRFVSYHRSGEYGGHSVFYDEWGRRADPDGIRDNTDKDNVSVAILGDSFVEALQVSYEDSFVGRLQAAAAEHVRVLNFGTSSYSPALYLLQWRNQIRPLSPSYVFIMLFGNDVRNDRDMTAVARFDSDGGIIAVRGTSASSFSRLGRLSYLARFIRKMQLQLAWAWQHRGQPVALSGNDFVEENPELDELTSGYLRRLIKGVRGSGAKIVLMAVPSRVVLVKSKVVRNAHSFHDIVQQWCEKHAVTFLNLEEVFRAHTTTKGPLFFDRDIHFTVEGHGLVAATILEAYPEVFAGGGR